MGDEQRDRDLLPEAHGAPVRVARNFPGVVAAQGKGCQPEMLAPGAPGQGGSAGLVSRLSCCEVFML